MMKKFALLAASLASLFAFNACNESEGQPGDPPADYDSLDKIDLEFSSHSLALQQANNCDDYRRHLLDATAKQIANIRFHASRHYPGDYEINGMEPGSAESSKDDAAAPSNPEAGDFTVTNIQETGADELDSVKNDGTYMYAIENNEIHITKIWPAEEMKALTPIKTVTDSNDSFHYILGILLDGNRLISIKTDYRWSSNKSHFTVDVYDVTDPAKVKLIKTHTIDGSFEDARLINHRLFIASSASVQGDWWKLHELAQSDIPGVPKFDEKCNWDWENDEAWEKCERKLKAWNDARDEHMKLYLPVIRAWLEKKYPTINDYDWPQYSDGTQKRDALDCQNLYLPQTTSSNSGLLMVSEFSGSDFENFNASAVVDDGWLVYASTKNLYLVSNSYSWFWDCNISDENCHGYSHIHHFTLGEKDGGLKYVNSGEVAGYVTDAFWMSDYDNHLRVVSSFNYWGNSSKGHKLTVFDNSTPNTMKTTGSVEGFGKDERLYSARMIKDKGYVVTYRNTDPLFTFDLSNPSDPKIAGELKINGYSSYIHPLGDSHLLTIGEDANENGRTLGMKLELFDVSDLANPKSTAKILINEERSTENSGSYGWSEALYDHHALNFHEASGLLAVPVNISKWHYTNNGYDWNYSHFSGMFVYRVTPSAGASAFEFVGGVDHAPIINDDEHWWTTIDRARFYFKDKGVYDKNAYIYTVSNHGILANDANDPKTIISSVKF